MLRKQGVAAIVIGAGMGAAARFAAAVCKVNLVEKSPHRGGRRPVPRSTGCPVRQKAVAD